MKINPWTFGLAAVGIITLASAARADESSSSVITALSSTTLSGYVDTSAQWNLGTGNVDAPGYAYGGAAKADGFNLNVVDLNLQKDADEKDGWGTGYRVELWAGPDANGAPNLGLGTSSTGTFADFAVKNAYVDLKVPVGTGIDFKMGVWDSMIGYEVADSPYNPNFTRSYGFSIEPTTFTGVQASYQINPFIGFSLGAANTFGPEINSRAFSTTGAPGFPAESYKTYMGAISLTAPQAWGWAAGSTLTGSAINGFNIDSPATVNSTGNGHADQTSLYVGGTLNTPLKALRLGASYDYVAVGKEPFLGNLSSSYANATALYQLYQVTDKFSLNAREEYFSRSHTDVLFPVFGMPAKVFAATLTAQYDLWKNVVSRVEFRWDHQADSKSDDFGGTANSQPFGSLRNSYELIANIVYKF
jgi:hypothetical protein